MHVVLCMLKYHTYVSIKELYCYLTKKLTSTPVIYEGHIFDELSLVEYFINYGKNPITGELLTHTNYYSCSLITQIFKNACEIIENIKKVNNNTIINLEINSENIMCPLSFETFIHPVFFDGFIFEKDYLQTWLKTSNKNPITRSTTENKKIYDIMILTNIINRLRPIDENETNIISSNINIIPEPYTDIIPKQHTDITTESYTDIISKPPYINTSAPSRIDIILDRDDMSTIDTLSELEINESSNRCNCLRNNLFCSHKFYYMCLCMCFIKCRCW